MKTIWLSPADFVSGDSSLVISYPFAAHPSTIVTCKQPGDFKWISMALCLPLNISIEEVTICYQISNLNPLVSPTSFISQIRLVEMKTPDTTLVLHDDSTDLTSTSPQCYTSKVGGVIPTAAVAVVLRLNFQNTTDQVLLGAVGVKVAPLTGVLPENASVGAATIAALRALTVPAQYAFVPVLAGADGAPFAAIFDQTSFAVDDGINYFKPDAVTVTSAGRWVRNPIIATAALTGVISATNQKRLNNINRVFNVRDFGADGLDGQGNSYAVESAAIQAAIGAALAAADDSPGAIADGAVVYFPRGRYQITGHPLIWKRTAQFKPIIVRGEGWSISQITNSKLGQAIFVVEDLTSDPSTHGAFMHGVEEIGLITNDGYCFHYDLGLAGDSRRAQVHFRKVWCYREHATDFAIRIVHGWRCRFVECVFTGGTNNGGGFLDIHETGGCYLLAVNMVGTGGAIIRCSKGNEIQLTGCRSEGARQIAAYSFIDSSEIVINGCTNEGKIENPANFYFENCINVVANTCGLATGDFAHTVGGGANKDTFCDGVVFVNCRGIRFNGYAPAVFYGSGANNDGTARAIKIDANCKDILVSIAGASVSGKDVDLDVGASDCHVIYTAPTGTLHYGKITLQALDVNFPTITVNCERKLTPEVLCGVDVRRGLNGPNEGNHVGLWWDEANTRFVAAFDTGGLHLVNADLGTRAKIEMLEALFPSGQPGVIRAVDGQTINFYDGTTLQAYFTRSGTRAKLVSGTTDFDVFNSQGGFVNLESTANVTINAGTNVQISASGKVLKVSSTGTELTGLLKFSTISDPATPANVGMGSTGRIVQYVSNQARAVISEIRFPWRKVAADLAAADITTELALFEAEEAITIHGAKLIPDDPVIAHGNNYATITLYRRDGAGGGASTVLSIATNVSSWPQFVPKPFGSLANNSLAAGNILTLNIAKAGAGVIVPSFALIIAFTVDH